jgi:hypothetical protein
MAMAIYNTLELSNLLTFFSPHGFFVCPFVVGNVTIIELKMLLQARILNHSNYFVMVSFSVQIT